MASASVSEVKARLSHYLDVVRRGGEVQILARGVPVARIVGVRGMPGKEPAKKRLARLLKSGLISPGTGDASWLLAEEPIDLGDADLSGALQEGREERL